MTSGVPHGWPEITIDTTEVAMRNLEQVFSYVFLQKSCSDKRCIDFIGMTVMNPTGCCNDHSTVLEICGKKCRQF